MPLGAVTGEANTGMLQRFDVFAKCQLLETLKNLTCICTNVERCAAQTQTDVVERDVVSGMKPVTPAVCPHVS